MVAAGKLNIMDVKPMKTLAQGLQVHGMVDEADLDLFEMVDDAEEAWAALVRRGLKPAPSPPARRAPRKTPR